MAHSLIAVGSYFNPRTREGCDLLVVGRRVAPFSISIHAPVKGATMYARLRTRTIWISIHAPVKGATIINPAFNMQAFHISIHAPVKGATGTSRISRRTKYIFQSTHP